MTNALDDAVRTALAEDAQRAPRPREWTGPSPLVALDDLRAVPPGRARHMVAGDKNDAFAAAILAFFAGQARQASAPVAAESRPS